MPRKKKTTQRFDPDNLWIVVQEGGSTGEAYIHSFNSAQDARDGEKELNRASYHVLASGPVSRFPAFNSRELATVLAALRYWQQDLVQNEEPPISPHFKEESPLTPDEINALCERINVE